ncbi:MAG: sugar transferase [Sphingomonas bacterium]|nr:sugar transferase [Sphingomonas bacterium]
MLHTAPLKSTGKPALVLRRRFEFAGALLLAAVVPWVGSRWLISDTTFDAAVFHNSLIANVLAICIALWIRISVSTYPGLRAGQIILPAVFVAHSTMLILLVLARIPYHRPSLALGFAIHLIFAYGIYFFVSRRLRPTIAIIPVGDTEQLRQIDMVDWQMLRTPDLHQVRECNAIVADFSDLSDEWEAFLADAALDGRMVYQVQQLLESLTGRVQVRHLSENSFGSLVPARAYSAIKHLGDFMLAVAVLPLLIPILALTALAIRLVDGGPVLFRQRRTGRKGHQFWVTKFRTMKVAGQIEDQRRAAMTDEDDVRVTKLGGLLRRSRIDELPQVWNILRGEMSWIGPRPEAEILSVWYTGDIPFYRYRHVVRPGISGWAQVNQGHVAEVDDIHLKLQYDFFYIKYFSPWLDILIMFRTIRTMLTGFGSK